MADQPRYVRVRFLQDYGEVSGFNGEVKTYGPFKKGEIHTLPKDVAELMIKWGRAEPAVKVEEPTLKEKFKGEVLTGYVEAAKVRPLMEFTEEERKKKAEKKKKDLLEKYDELLGQIQKEIE